MNRADWTNGRVVVLGSGGMLGRELMGVLANRLEGSTADRLVGLASRELDIGDRDAVGAALRRIKPAVVINAAGYTDVDGCETNIDRATAVNAEAPGHVAVACTEVGAKLVHFGTDYIFDGTSDRPYRPDDVANPLSVYGRSKWAGEQAVAASGDRYLIVRTSGLFGLYGHNFVEAIVKRAESGAALRVVTDQIGRPTWACDLADAVVRLLDTDAVGTFHFANSGECSWFGFAEEIVRQAGLHVPMQRITAAELGRAAERPAYSVLDTSEYQARVKQAPASWSDALQRYLKARGARRTTTVENSPPPEPSVPCGRAEAVAGGAANGSGLV